METKYIIDKTTGTVLDLAGCYIINGDQLDDTFTDSEVSDLADRVGRKVVDTADYTEEQALGLVSRFAQQYGWKGTMFTRTDVRQAVIDHYGWAESLDEKVDKVMATRMWVKTLEDSIIREGMECIYDAIQQIENGE